VKRIVRLSRSSDIKKVQRQGRSFVGTCAVLLVLENFENQTRLGVIASTAVGNAVKRNKARRRIKACLMQFQPLLTVGVDILIIARRSINCTEYQELKNEIERLLHQAGVLGINGNDLQF